MLGSPFAIPFPLFFPYRIDDVVKWRFGESVELVRGGATPA
jgi:hypothetical protein